MMSSEGAEVENRVQEISQLEERVKTTDAYTEALRPECTRVEELRAESLILAARGKQTQTERDTMKNFAS